MTRFLLDADCAIYVMSGAYPLLRGRLEEQGLGDVALSAISLAEIALGTALGTGPDPARLDDLLRTFPVLPFDLAEARAYARLPFKRARFDRLLAAHALSVGATIVTNNEADFVDIPDLRVENWTR